MTAVNTTVSLFVLAVSKNALSGKNKIMENITST
jgi:hypothetical protein